MQNATRLAPASRDYSAHLFGFSPVTRRTGARCVHTSARDRPFAGHKEGHPGDTLVVAPSRKAPTMPERLVRIASKSGLHARPAAIFSQAASEQPVAVTIEKSGGAPVRASSILMILTLNADHGEEVILRAEGDGADAALDALAALLERNLDEDF